MKRWLHQQRRAWRGRTWRATLTSNQPRRVSGLARSATPAPLQQLATRMAPVQSRQATGQARAAWEIQVCLAVG